MEILGCRRLITTPDKQYQIVINTTPEFVDFLRDHNPDNILYIAKKTLDIGGCFNVSPGDLYYWDNDSGFILIPGRLVIEIIPEKLIAFLEYVESSNESYKKYNALMRRLAPGSIIKMSTPDSQMKQPEVPGADQKNGHHIAVNKSRTHFIFGLEFHRFLQVHAPKLLCNNQYDESGEYFELNWRTGVTGVELNISSGTGSIPGGILERFMKMLNLFNQSTEMEYY